MVWLHPEVLRRRRIAVDPEATKAEATRATRVPIICRYKADSICVQSQRSGGKLVDLWMGFEETHRINTDDRAEQPPQAGFSHQRFEHRWRTIRQDHALVAAQSTQCRNCVRKDAQITISQEQPINNLVGAMDTKTIARVSQCVSCQTLEVHVLPH